ncbi:hypothetical protein D3C87_1289080 [compost metagenome]
MRKAQQLQDPLSVADHFFELVEGRLRMDDLDQLDLVELVDPDEPLGVAARGARLRAEARRVGGQVLRQHLLGDDLVAVDVGQRHLGRRDQVVLGVGEVEELIGELRQVAVRQEGFLVGHEGRQDLGVAVVAGVKVEHEADERPLELSTGAAHHHEARTRQLGGPLEVEHAQGLTDFPVGLGLVRELRGRSPAANLDVLVLGEPFGNRRVHQVGDLVHQGLTLGLVLGHLGFEALDLGSDLAGSREQLGDVLAFLLEARDGLADRVPLLAQGVQAGLGLAEAQVERDQPVEIEFHAAALQAALHAFGFGADQLDV